MGEVVDELQTGLSSRSFILNTMASTRGDTTLRVRRRPDALKPTLSVANVLGTLSTRTAPPPPPAMERLFQGAREKNALLKEKQTSNNPERTRRPLKSEQSENSEREFLWPESDPDDHSKNRTVRVKSPKEAASKSKSKDLPFPSLEHKLSSETIRPSSPPQHLPDTPRLDFADQDEFPDIAGDDEPGKSPLLIAHPQSSQHGSALNTRNFIIPIEVPHKRIVGVKVRPEVRHAELWDDRTDADTFIWRGVVLVSDGECAHNRAPLPPAFHLLLHFQSCARKGRHARETEDRPAFSASFPAGSRTGFHLFPWVPRPDGWQMTLTVPIPLRIFVGVESRKFRLKVMVIQEGESTLHSGVEVSISRLHLRELERGQWWARLRTMKSLDD